MTKEPVHKDTIIALRAEGKTYTEIQALTGASKGTISYHLGRNQHEKTAERRRKARSKVTTYIQKYKQSMSCADCGERYPYWIMEFDHLRDKEFQISSYQNRSQDLEVIKAEIDKCEVVCSNCHRNRTYFRSARGLPDHVDFDEIYGVSWII